MQTNANIEIGTSMEGGYFGGIINVNGTHNGVIWAPKQAGQIKSILLPSAEHATHVQAEPCAAI